MKHLLFILISLSILSVQGQTLRVMSYNIKLDYPKEGKNSWLNRKPFLINQVKFYEPDIMGVQEAMPGQMKDLDRLLVDYSYVGVGRDDGKNEGEYSAIFYKTEKFKAIKSSTFWLSKTPEKIGMGWDAVCNRICTYVLLEDLETKQSFWMFNTHFDHVGKEARKNSAILVLDKIKRLNTKKYPVLLSGDFNMESAHESIQLIKKTLKDSRETTKISFGPHGTFNGFHFDKPVIRRIDYIFVSREIKVKKYAVLSDNWNLQYPSDHLPVYIEVKLAKQLNN